jgi:Uma2 family endonuclease
VNGWRASGRGHTLAEEVTMVLPARKTPKPATYADILALPDHVVGQIVEGELYVAPRPASRHARASTKIVAALGSFDSDGGGPNDPGGWWLAFEPELHLGRNVLVPDIAGWRRERLPDWPDVAYFTLAPDWVCEIVSPRSASMDRVKKMRLYGEAGVTWMWLVDPVEQFVESYVREGERWVQAGAWDGAEEAARIPPFDAVAIELPRWWGGSTGP